MPSSACPAPPSPNPPLRVQLDFLGVQYSRYMRLIKFVGWLTLGATLVMVPNLIMFHDQGARFHDWSGIGARPFTVGTLLDAKRSLATFSLGNLVRPMNDTLYEIPGVGMEVEARQFSLVVAGIMCLAGVLLALGALWLWVSDGAMTVRSSWAPYGSVTLEVGAPRLLCRRPGTWCSNSPSPSPSFFPGYFFHLAPFM